MHNEVNTIKKKKIILSTNRKSNAKCTSSAKEATQIEEQQSHQDLMNCISINNSLEIFQDDPKNRHFHFLENQEERIQSQCSIKGKGILQESEVQQKDKGVFCKNKKEKMVPLIQKTVTTFSKISLLKTNSCNSSQFLLNPKKLSTSPNCKYIDLTLKKNPSKTLLSNKSSFSFFSSKPHQQNSCTLQSYDSRTTQRSILSSVSVNSLHFNNMNRSTSQRKKPLLTITCHKYKQNFNDKKMKEQNGINKCNSIKLFKKCI